MIQVQARAPFAGISTFSGVGDSLPSIKDSKDARQIRLRGDGEGARIYIKEPRGILGAGKVSESAARYQANAVKALGNLFVKDLTQTLRVSKERAQWIFGAAAPRREQILVGHYRALVQARTTIEVLSKIEGIPTEQAAKLVNDAIRSKLDLKDVTPTQLKAAAAVIKHRPETSLAQAIRLLPLVDRVQGALGLPRAGALVGELITAAKHGPVTYQQLDNACAYLQAARHLPADVALKVATTYETQLLKLAQNSQHPAVLTQLFGALANEPLRDSLSLIRVAHDTMAQCGQLSAHAALEHAEVSGKWCSNLLGKHKLSFAQVEELLAAAKTPAGDFTHFKLDEAAALVAAQAGASPKSILLAMRQSSYDGFKTAFKGNALRAIELVQALNQLGVKQEALEHDPSTRAVVDKVVDKLVKDPQLSAERACRSTKFPGIVPPRTYKVLARQSPPAETKRQDSSPVSAHAQPR